MMEKIPFNSLKSQPKTEKDKKLIKCTLCDGVLYEPAYSIKLMQNCCKTCILEKNNIDPDNLSINYGTLYKPVSKQIKSSLNSYNYSCPNFDFEENKEEIHYTYDDLINHLIICDNNKIKCPSCGADTYLKNIEKNQKQKLLTTLIRNKILERELEYQRSRIIEMEAEKKETLEVHKQKKAKEIIEKNPKEKKEKIQITVKKPPLNKLHLFDRGKSANKLTRIKKGELPPIKRKSRVYEKKEVNTPQLNFRRNNGFKKRETPKELVPDNSNNNTLFDKCPHFFGNYMPKFACCNKFYGCYLCHNENENHIYKFSNKVACLFCKTVYAGKTCTKCRANQIFKRKNI